MSRLYREFYDELFHAVRAVNASLFRERRLRVLLGDPPTDWSNARSADETRGSRRRSGAARFCAALFDHEPPADTRTMKTLLPTACAALLACAASIAAQGPAPLAALARMPVKEITVFKDGHAFVLHEGTLPTDAAGNVVMDYLPTPVLGTFWPYSANKDVKLAGVVAGQRRVLVEETALSLAELLDANAGIEAIVAEKPPGPRYACTIIGIPERSSEELAMTGLPNAAPSTPAKGHVVLVRTSDGVKVVLLDNILDVTFKTPHKSKLAHEEFRNLLTLKLDWAGRRPSPTAEVGLVYVQKGVRWIPGYKVALDGNGNAAIKLQATLLNELADIDDVTANLVIGVPSFAFRDTLDPISLQQSAAQLSPYFQQGDRMQMMTNAIASQVGGIAGGQLRNAPAAPAAPSLGPDLPESTKSEDLFVFTARHVTMKKGERMVAPVAEYAIPYTDIFALELPFAPPRDIRSSLNTGQEAEMARLLGAPQVAHKIRLTNKGSYPLTTAPALVVRDNRVLAQGMMTYAAVGATTDLEVTKAVDIKVAKSDEETARVPNAVRWQGDDYGRVDLAGKIKLTNYRDKAVEVEVTRHVLGNVNGADNGGVITRVNVFEDGSYTTADHPQWWGWYSWPNWWSHFNGVGRVSWKISIAPGKSADLGYTWHYFWR